MPASSAVTSPSVSSQLHSALPREEVVVRRRWLRKQTFRDLLDVAYLLSGLLLRERIIHYGSQRMGWPVSSLRSILFIVPMVTLALLLAWLSSQ